MGCNTSDSCTIYVWYLAEVEDASRPVDRALAPLDQDIGTGINTGLHRPGPGLVPLVPLQMCAPRETRDCSKYVTPLDM